MSYILEALKKLEQKREQEESPKVVTFSRETAVKHKKRRIWPYPLAVALLLNAGVVVWLVRQPRVEQPAQAVSRAYQPPTSNGSARTTAKAPEQAVAKASAPASHEERKEGLATEAARTAAAERIVPDAPLRKEAAVTPEAPLRKQPAPPAQPQTQTRKEKASPAPEPKAPREQRAPASTEPAYALKELPPFIRNDLPEFKVSGHAYSSHRQNRVVRINDKILQEGDELSKGLRVEEIIPDGVVLSYQGYRFRIDVTFNR